MASNYGVAPATQVLPPYKNANPNTPIYADAPRYLSNPTLHNDLGILFIKDVLQERSTKQHDRLEVHPKALLQPLQEKQNNRRLKRRLAIDLKWSRRGFFAGEALILLLEGLTIFVLHHQISPWNVLILIANKKIVHLEARFLPHTEWSEIDSWREVHATFGFLIPAMMNSQVFFGTKNIVDG